jgi:hypothetical protein
MGRLLRALRRDLVMDELPAWSEDAAKVIHLDAPRMPIAVPAAREPADDEIHLRQAADAR